MLVIQPMIGKAFYIDMDGDGSIIISGLLNTNCDECDLSNHVIIIDAQIADCVRNKLNAERPSVE